MRRWCACGSVAAMPCRVTTSTIHYAPKIFRRGFTARIIGASAPPPPSRSPIERATRLISQPVTVGLLVALGEFGLRKAVILRAVRFDLDRPHERGNAAGGRPVHAVRSAVQQAGAIGV